MNNEKTLVDLHNDIWSIITNHLHRTDVNNLYRTSNAFNDYVKRWSN